MAKPKPVVIDGEFTQVTGKSLADVVAPDIVSITTREGKLIPRDQFERTPIPDGFETNLSAINKGAQ